MMAQHGQNIVDIPALKRRESHALAALLEIADEAADIAGEVVRRYFRSPLLDVDLKGDNSPVTKADREAERAIRELLSRHVAGHGIIGEEYGATELDHEIQWILDPIDGTKSFISGNPLFGCLIAVVIEGRPVLGVVDLPALGERWSGYVSADAATLLYNGKPCISSPPRNTCLHECQVHSTSPEMFGSAFEQAVSERMASACRNRRWGGDCMNYALLANGQVDVILEAGMQSYDYMAPAAVVEAAGCVITDWLGNPLRLNPEQSQADQNNGGADSFRTGQVLAARTAELHAEALEVISGKMAPS